jgi:putative endonuclease
MIIAAKTDMTGTMEDMTGHYMYVLRCADGSLYTGYTVDVARRLAQHQAGKASRYTRTRRPVTVAGWWQFEDKRSAMQAEWAFKQLSRAEKLRCLAESASAG